MIELTSEANKQPVLINPRHVVSVTPRIQIKPGTAPVQVQSDFTELAGSRVQLVVGAHVNVLENYEDVRDLILETRHHRKDLSWQQNRVAEGTIPMSQVPTLQESLADLATLNTPDGPTPEAVMPLTTAPDETPEREEPESSSKKAPAKPGPKSSQDKAVE